MPSNHGNETLIAEMCGNFDTLSIMQTISLFTVDCSNIMRLKLMN